MTLKASTKISLTALSAINNLVIDVDAAAKATETHVFNNAYAAAHQSKCELVEYVAGLEKRLGIEQTLTVRR